MENQSLYLYRMGALKTYQIAIIGCFLALQMEKEPYFRLKLGPKEFQFTTGHLRVELPRNGR